MQQLNVYQLVSSRLPVYTMSINCIAHYQVAFRLCVETSLRAKPFLKMCFFRFYKFYISLLPRAPMDTSLVTEWAALAKLSYLLSYLLTYQESITRIFHTNCTLESTLSHIFSFLEL